MTNIMNKFTMINGLDFWLSDIIINLTIRKSNHLEIQQS